MLDEYGSGDSGGSNSSYRKRFIDQRKSTKTPSSARMSGDASIMRLGYDTALANRSSTLPYKRRGSWHVDREANFSTLDWNTSRNLWSKSRWRSFSPERLALETRMILVLLHFPRRAEVFDRKVFTGSIS
ncbi:hypothetical protein ECG_05752 [Echinococcus granulosus]|nr:hypothetical protein ECG_05752 [Echinococcus granulosus]